MRRNAGVAALSAIMVLAGLVGGCMEPAFKSEAVQEEAASARSQFTGQSAPDFTLKDQNDADITLSKLRGQWVVLYFYPKDDTPGCTCQATEFTSLIGKFRDMNARVFGVSSDSVRTHKVFVEKFGLGIDLLSDPDHAVGRRYGAWVDTMFGDKKVGRVIRSTVIVNPQGVVAYHWPEVIPKGHADRVRQKLAELQAGAK